MSSENELLLLSTYSICEINDLLRIGYSAIAQLQLDDMGAVQVHQTLPFLLIAASLFGKLTLYFPTLINANQIYIFHMLFDLPKVLTLVNLGLVKPGGHM